MTKRYRVAGTVSYLNEKGQRLAIPYGTHVEVEELNGENPAAIMRWKDEQGVAHQQNLNLLEWAEYAKRGLKPL